MLLQFSLGFAMAIVLANDVRSATADICDEFKVSGGPGAEMGYAVDLDGSFAAIGAPEVDFGFGWVHIYERMGDAWTPVAFIEPQENAREDHFGKSVAIEGTILVAGAPERDANGFENSGAAFVFERQSNGEWIEGQQLVPDEILEEAEFGAAVALQGNTLAIGAPGRFGVVGKVHVFRKISGAWIESQTLTTGDDESFGNSIAMEGVRMIIGAIGEQEFRGATYFYEFDGNEWVQVQRLTAPDRQPGDHFGTAVAFEGDLVVVGANNDQVGDAWDAGSAHIFHLVNGTWVHQQQIHQPNPQVESKFGRDVDIQNGVIYIAAAFERFLTHAQGALYRFEHNGTEWVNTLRLVPSDAEPGGEAFGAAIDIEDDTLLVGAWRDDDNGTNAGAAYFYDLECGELATLNSITVVFGRHLAGGLHRILESDDLYYRSRSNPGFTATEPNLIELRINATAAGTAAPLTLDLIIEGRISQPGGSARVRLRDWNAGPNQFQTVHTYLLGMSEATEFIENVPEAGNYIRAADGRMQLSLRQSVFATFSALGFESLLDFVSIEVEE